MICAKGIFTPDDTKVRVQYFCLLLEMNKHQILTHNLFNQIFNHPNKFYFCWFIIKKTFWPNLYCWFVKSGTFMKCWTWMKILCCFICFPLIWIFEEHWVFIQKDSELYICSFIVTELFTKMHLKTVPTYYFYSYKFLILTFLDQTAHAYCFCS